ncbi:FkbM family methyltransferase [Verrucomicrobiota bacterium sgz303538]
MLPVRFRILAPYLASFIFSRTPRPPFLEVLKYLLQPSKTQRASKYIKERVTDGEYFSIRFSRFPQRAFYYPVALRWESLCQTVDECFDPQHWHQFLSGEIDLKPDDVVVDCGAAEGLFTFVAAQTVQRVFAVEPVPAYLAALRRNFGTDQNVTVLPYAVGHRQTQARMSQNELASHISAEGELAIEVRPLDDLFPEDGTPVSFLKGDVEGYEFPMLLGAQRLIAQHRPRIVLAVYHPQNCVPEICDYLRSIHKDYRFRMRGISEVGNPVLLQAW